MVARAPRAAPQLREVLVTGFFGGTEGRSACWPTCRCCTHDNPLLAGLAFSISSWRCCWAQRAVHRGFLVPITTVPAKRASNVSCSSCERHPGGQPGRGWVQMWLIMLRSRSCQQTVETAAISTTPELDRDGGVVTARRMAITLMTRISKAPTRH
jgi:hypothetical protein